VDKYMQNLMNDENKWHHEVFSGVKEGPTDCITIPEIIAALKKMNKHEAAGLSGLVAEWYKPPAILEFSG